MADRSGYIGRAPSDSAVTVARQTFSPTGVTTDFTFASGYTVGYLDLFLNGTKLIEGVDYNATDTSTISLVSAAINGDILEGVAYKAFNLGDGSRIGIQSAGILVGNVNTLNFVGAGNSISLNGGAIDVSISGGGGGGGSAGAGGTWGNYDGNTGVTTTKKVKIQNDLEVTGVTTSTGGFVGALTGNASSATILASSRNIGGVAFNGSADINLPGVNASGTQNTSGTAGGLSGTPNIVVGSVTGTTGSFTGNVSVGGTLTYEDVTNVDSVGLITARKGANSSGPFSWNLGTLTTFDPPTGAGSDTATDVAIALGGGHRIVGYFDGYIRSLLEWNQSDNIIIGQSSTGLISGIELKPGSSGSVKSYYNNDIKFQTTGVGASVTGAVAGYDYLQAPFSTTVNFAVTVASKTAAHRYPAGGGSSGSGYVINGVQSPFLTLTPGRTYKFDQSNNTNSTHPLRFYLEADKTTAYTTNVTTNGTPGSAGAYTQIVVTDSTPQVLHYQCSAHGYMGNAVNTNSNVPAVSAEAGVVDFVASGAIANGATVLIKTDGTVTVVAENAVSTPTAGTPDYFEGGTGNLAYSSTTFDSNSNRIVIAYRHSSNPYGGRAVVGTVSGSTITFGTPVEFESGQCNYIGAGFDSTNNKVIIAYQDDGDGQKGKAVVGTVNPSGNSISFGSPVQFEAGRTNHVNVAHVSSSTNRVVIVYCDEDNNNYATAIVGEVNTSNNSISFGTSNTFYNATSSKTNVVYDPDTDRVIAAWAEGSSKGRTVVGTVNGPAKTITWGSTSEFDTNAVNGSLIGLVYSSTDERIIVSWRDSGNYNYGTARVGTVTGGSGNSIAYGSPSVFETSSTNKITSSYDSTNNKVMIAYRDAGNSNYGTAVIGTVNTSNNSITFTTPLVFESAAVSPGNVTSAFASNVGKSVIAYVDGGDSDKAKALVFSSNSNTTNLTTENYIGIAAEAIANGATGKINIIGGVNTGQSSLTVGKTYYVRSNGSLATSAGIPSVVAGTSIASTKIIVKG